MNWQYLSVKLDQLSEALGEERSAMADFREEVRSKIADFRSGTQSEFSEIKRWVAIHETEDKLTRAQTAASQKRFMFLITTLVTVANIAVSVFFHT